MQFVDLKAQYREYKAEIDKAVHEVLDNCQFIMGPQVHKIEEVLAAYAGSKHGITTASGTDSLVIALMALGVGPGDEVITTPFSWISTAEVIALLNAKPVFVDIDPDTYNLDPELLEAAITPKTKAIMPVSLYGQMANMTRINAIADQYGLPVIEDAAQSFGASHKGAKSCAASTIGSTSFFPAKAFGCYGDGGGLFTNDDELAEKMRAIRTHGGLVRNHHPLVGLNGRFDTIQAAVLLAKWPHYGKEVQARQRLARRYDEALSAYCKTPKVEEGNEHIYACYTIEVEERDQVVSALKEQGIPTAVYYPKCMHQQPVFESLGYGPGSFPAAEAAAGRVLSLPIHPWLSDEEQSKIIAGVEATALVPA